VELDAAGAATAVGAILRHAASQPDGMVSIRYQDGALVVASPGETSLLTAHLEAPNASADLDGAYLPPSAANAGSADAVALEPTRDGVRIQLGKRRVDLKRDGDPVDIDWLWPAAPATLDAVVSRDALLEALPSGEGRLTFSGADKQLVLLAGKQERRVPLKNRPRRRNDLGTPVAFDQLRLLAEAAGPEVSVQLADLRPLTISSGPVRGVLVRGAPMRWTNAPAPRQRAAAPTRRAPAAAARRAEAERAERERAERERERAERERERAEARRAKTAEQAMRALVRAAGQLDAAADLAGELDDGDLVRRIKAAGRSVRKLAEGLGSTT
jgi:uncharacterized protein YaiL (DUF2058 family)